MAIQQQHARLIPCQMMHYPQTTFHNLQK
ncbi:Mod_r superfamily domain-containing protein [Histoplasma capsulatum]|uniref:Mod_r superfamily domain-containing protein n=1 Tax=Ajellomyces capsulatus TaxID=5037 RepID=A0A8A1M7Z1_AJECA|nr:Mod_r superfamily domain-containing protein [Histoplasma capsulatum]